MSKIKILCPRCNKRHKFHLQTVHGEQRWVSMDCDVDLFAD